MKVLITGGTGYVGSHTTAAVLRQGHQVRLLVRDESRVAPALLPLGVDPAGVEVLIGDVTDADSVAKATDGVDAVVHLATVFSMDSRDARRMARVTAPGVRNVLEHAHRAGADPIVYASSYAALLPSDQKLTTDLPPGQAGPPYFVAQAAAEHVAREYQANGAPVVIVNMLATIGPHDPHVGDQLTRLRNAVKGRLKVMPTGGFSINDVRDVAALLAAALRPGLGPRRFFPGGHHISTVEYIRAVETTTGRRLRTLFVPARAAMPLCRLVDIVQHVVPWHIPAEYTAAYMCNCDAHIDESMPKAPLGVEPRPLLTTIGDSIVWLREQGHLTAEQAGLLADRKLSLAG
ncbi:NAD-dependent epimerase/dehydratase family protein [Micromonospora sp. SL1-18]|uniref:NAD-dependent epimerase/dehydratase family protein n=1 Tax=Micromonospora sp. SL1-18 TaxID=3399128 RepID=UPI003A4E3A16